jgi:polyhydroxyalkanoate synthesis repressor PhaR
MAQTVIIKKYENRRLYDATNSRYVNLDEVAQLVQQGHDVQVVDATSGEDLTRQVLTQIIAEGAKNSESNFPLDILRQMVIASDRASQENAVRYTKAMLDLYKSTYQAMAPALKPFEFLHNPQGTAPPPAQPTASGSPTHEPEGRSEPDEMVELRKRIAELEKTVSSIRPGVTGPGAEQKPKKRPNRRAPAQKRRAVKT